MAAELDVILQIKSILWQVVGNGAIFTGEVLDDSHNPTGKIELVRTDYRAIGRESSVGEGDVWRIVGERETFEGKPQIGAKKAFLCRPTGDHIKYLLANNPMFEGIGKVYADRLWLNLDSKLYDLLNEGNHHALTEAMIEADVRGAEKVAQTAIEAWQALGCGEVVSWLDSLRGGEKLGVKMGRKIYEYWGDKAKDIVIADPYRLLPFIGRYKGRRAWNVVNDIAQRVFSVSVDDKRRFHAAIIDSLYFMYDEKSTVVDRKTLRRELVKRLGNVKLAERALKETFDSGAFLTNGCYWQTQGAFHMEKAVAEGFVQLASIKRCDLFGENTLDVDRMQTIMREFEEREGYELGAEQKAAVQTVLKSQVVIVTGGAGVGKTTVLKCVHEYNEEAGGKVIQMALSGRASRRMADATKRPAITIAGFLHKDQDFSGNTTIIIDEASMLDLPLTYRIIKKVPLGCRMVLVGDPEQLSPIGTGKVFHVLTKDVKGLFPIAELNTVYRQDGATGIPAVAEAVRRGEWPELPLFDGQKGIGVSVIPAAPEDLLGSLGEDGVYRNGILENLYEQLGGNDEDVQVLSATNKSDPCSTSGINVAFQNKYSLGNNRVLKWYDHIDDFLKGWVDAGFREGDKVVFNHNDWGRELFNGSLGVVKKAHGLNTDPEPIKDGPRMMVDFDTGVQEIYEADLESVTLAYAITIHKAQGSQFERIIIPVRKARNLDRSMIYTAITRGVSQVVLVGDINAAAEAVRSKPQAELRQVGLGRLLELVARAEKSLSVGG